MRKCRFFSLLICLILLLNISVTAMADEPGTLNVQILETGTGFGLQGAVVNIYQVAYISGVDYIFTDSFSACGFDLNSIGSLTAAENSAAAAYLDNYVRANAIGFTKSKSTDASGAVEFTGLSLGLYLVIEAAPASGHSSVSPFLITIPQVVNGEDIYLVSAAPKIGTADPVVPTSTPSPTETPYYPPYDPNYKPVYGVAPAKLPQTGQLWWPVYPMAGMGLALVLYGWVKKRESANE